MNNIKNYDPESHNDFFESILKGIAEECLKMSNEIDDKKITTLILLWVKIFTRTKL